MKKLTLLSLTAFALALTVITGCNHQPPLKKLTLNLPVQTQTYNDTKYRSVTVSGGDNSPITNPLTDAGATLGRVLFYDPRLSVNNTISCSSCHKQQFGFGDNQPFSTGFQGQLTLRNTPAIINAANKSVFFWDGRVNSLETQTLMPVKNHIEMGLENENALSAKLGSISDYPGLFQSAFGSTEITTEKISMALSQFVRSIASYPQNGLLTGDALAGRILFLEKYKCSSCHAGSNLGGAAIFFPYYPVTHAPTSVANTSNIGLDLVYSDQGIQAINGDPAQNGYFVIPALRNVALTAPYMHDGRYSTLSQVIDHYSTGILPHPNLDPILIDTNFAAGQILVKTGNPVKMNISDIEKKQLIAYLTSLTDYSITTDQRFSSPFK